MIRIGGASFACVLAAVAACSRSTNPAGVDRGKALTVTLGASVSPIASNRDSSQSGATADEVERGALNDGSARGSSVRRWGDEGSLDAGTGAVDAATPCLFDAGARRGVVVRFVVHPNELAISGTDLRATTLNLEIPSLGVRHRICESNCPYGFVSRKETQTRATFECQTDDGPTEGSVSIVGDVLVIEAGEARPHVRVLLPSRERQDAAPPPAPLPRTREVIPLPCGLPVTLQTSPPSQCPLEAKVSQ